MRRLIAAGTLVMISSWALAAGAQVDPTEEVPPPENAGGGMPGDDTADDDAAGDDAAGEDTAGEDTSVDDTTAEDTASVDATAGVDTGDEDDADAGDDGTSSDTILPLPEAARPLVSPPMTIRGDFHVPIIQLGVPGFSQTVVGFPFLGGAISLTDWLQLEAAVIPVIVSPSAEYFSPELGATFSFLGPDADIEVGARVSFQVPGSTEYYALNFGVPVRFHLVDDMLRIDTGAFFAMYGSTAGGDPAFGLMQSHTIPLTQFGPSIPAEVIVSPIDYIYAKAGTGFGIIDLTENFAGLGAGDLVFIPLGFGVGGNIPLSREMILDAKFDFSFPLFATPGLPGDKVNPDFYQIGITGSLHYSIE